MSLRFLSPPSFCLEYALQIYLWPDRRRIQFKYKTRKEKVVSSNDKFIVKTSNIPVYHFCETILFSIWIYTNIAMMNINYSMPFDRTDYYTPDEYCPSTSLSNNDLLLNMVGLFSKFKIKAHLFMYAYNTNAEK